MIYKAIGLMSGSSLDGLDIVYTQLHESAGRWTYEIIFADCLAYDEEWTNKLSTATRLSARDYQLLHSDYGHFTGQQVNRFIRQHQLEHKVDLVASHGHTSFHMPEQKMTAQLGDGAAIAAETGLPVVSELRALDIALGGQGAPIVPIGEKLLWPDHDLFLNLGGIANLSAKTSDGYIAFDVCPANRVLNMLAGDAGKEYDEDGKLAASGKMNEALLESLNDLDYYSQAYPKSLANDFGTDIVYPLIRKSALSAPDALRTYSEHIAIQISRAISQVVNRTAELKPGSRMLITGGGAFNLWLVKRITSVLEHAGIEAVVPGKDLVSYKEALVMALIGVLRWREENNVISSVTGASRSSVGGALWMGGEA